MNQKTVAAPCVLQGVGVHSGQPSTLTIHPAPADGGLVWNKAFIMGKVIPVEAPHATVLANEHARISTVEHVMAALWQQGITNARLELDGDEVPILDGSSIAIIWALEKVGVVELDAPAKFVMPRETLTFVDEARGGVIEIQGITESWIPDSSVAKAMVDTQAREGESSGCQQLTSPQLQLTSSRTRSGIHENEMGTGSSPARRTTSNMTALTIDYQSREGAYKGELTPETFANDIAPARTFGDIAQLPMLRSHGLAQGSTLGNTVAFHEGKPLNNPRFADEPLRHKILDLIGDLYLLGLPLAGHITARNTGHSFNRQVVAHYVAHPELWQVSEGGVGSSQTLVSRASTSAY